MKRFLLIALCALLLAGAGLRLDGAQPQEPRFRAGTDAVSVYVTVVDAEGRLVSDLTADDFEVLDNGVPQKLTLFANTAQPITVVVMIDRSSSVENHFRLVEKAAASFVDTLLPGDRARIGSFSNDVRLDPADFTSDKAELHQILATKLQAAGSTPLWRAMTTSMDALGAERRRRVVLVFSDGMDSSGLLSSTTTFDDVRRRVQAEDVMVYTVGLAVVCDSKPAARLDGPGSPVLSFAATGGQGRSSPPPPPGRIRIPPRPPLPRPPDPGRIPGRPPVDPFGRPAKTSDDEARCRESRPDPGLKELAGLGGGGYFELSGPNDLARTFARVADELHRQYLLAFPAPAADGQVHALDVRLRQPNLTVRARKSYLAPAAR